MNRSHVASLILAVLYGSFALWYTPLGGPLSNEEIDDYLANITDQGAEAHELSRLRGFLEGDTGDDFVMFNVIALREPPMTIDGVDPEDTATDVLATYMDYMWPALLQRGCHPVMGGTAASDALDLFGIDGAEAWSQGVAMRYRSRRDMMDILVHPSFHDSHRFKIAAMTKTIAFPIDPWFQLGDPRLILGMLTVILILSVQQAPRVLGSARRPQ